MPPPNLLTRIRAFLRAVPVYLRALCGGASLVVVLFFIALDRRRRSQLRLKNFMTKRELALRKYGEVYDVCIIGCGPSGATCAYHCCAGGLKVLTIEKKPFPRDKVCGDALVPAAQAILQEMGVMNEIIESGAGVWARTGGMVSPSGKSFIGEFTCDRVLTVPRIVLDNKIATAAAAQGAVVAQGQDVLYVKYLNDEALWQVVAVSESESSKFSVYYATAVVAADGASSKIARSLGLVTSPPNAFSCRAFALPGTHTFPADNVLLYTGSLTPGYVCINRDLEDYLNISVFLLPGSRVSQQKFPQTCIDLFSSDELLVEALGADVAITPLQAVPMRVGGISKSFSEHLLVVGEAAGHVNPLTGEGLQYGMQAGQIAARVLCECFAKGDLSGGALSSYQKRWYRAFGWDFLISSHIAQIFRSYPHILDAAAEVIQHCGGEVIQSWSLVRTGQKTKLWWLRPDVGPMIVVETVRLWLGGLLPAPVAPASLARLRRSSSSSMN